MTTEAPTTTEAPEPVTTEPTAEPELVVEPTPLPDPAPTPVYPEAGYPQVEAATPPPVHYPDVYDALADLESGELLGHPVGAPAAEVLASLEAEFGSVDDHDGWHVPCDIEELSVSAGGFWVHFERTDDGDHMTGWQAFTDGPIGDRIALPNDAVRSMSMNELALQIGSGQALTVIPDWDMSRLDILGPGSSPWFIGRADVDQPSSSMGHGRTDPSCYDI